MSNDNKDHYHAGFTGVLVAADGTKRWFINGMYGRADEGPSVEYPDGSYCYYAHPQNAPAWAKFSVSVPHRKDGPAVFYSDGTQYFYKYGQLHRRLSEGPAAIYSDGKKEYWYEGKLYTVNDLIDICRENEFLRNELRESDGGLWHILKYEDTDYPTEQWKEDVVNHVTRFGYTEWVERKKSGESLSESEPVGRLSESLDLLSSHYGIATGRARDQLILKREREVLAELDDHEKGLYKKRRLECKSNFSPILDVGGPDRGHKIFSLTQWINEVILDKTVDGYIDWVYECSEECDLALQSKEPLTEAELRREDKLSWVALQRLSAYYGSDEEDVTLDIVLKERLRLFKS